MRVLCKNPICNRENYLYLNGSYFPTTKEYCNFCRRPFRDFGVLVEEIWLFEMEYGLVTYRRKKDTLRRSLGTAIFGVVVIVTDILFEVLIPIKQGFVLRGLPLLPLLITALFLLLFFVSYLINHVIITRQMKYPKHPQGLSQGRTPQGCFFVDKK